MDWDLKRDIARKLEKLERRTQRAIVQIIRESLSHSLPLPHNAPINGNPHPQVGWGNSGDLTKCCVENPTPGVLPNVNTPIGPNITIGDLTPPPMALKPAVSISRTLGGKLLSIPLYSTGVG